jgi:phosphohistidine phosphatase
MGTFMRGQGLVPDQVLCSAARRAVETWEFISEALEKRIPAEIREDFYHASPQTLLSAIRALSPELESVLLVGHNPTMENLALSLAGHGEEGILREMRLKYPTGALAILDFPVSSWADVREGGGHLRGFIRPRHLK